MPPFLSASKAVGSRLFRKDGIKQLIRTAGSMRQMGKYVPDRCPSSFAALSRCSGYKVIDSDAQNRGFGCTLGDVCAPSVIQKRHFLGCGDGEEGSVLSKIHEERRVIGYSPEQLFAVVAAVDLYEDFLPWCQRSDIVRRHSDGSFDAELEIGFKFLVESYVSHVVMDKPRYIKTTSSESNLFEHLINVWEFSPGPAPGTCSLYFLVDFKFQSPLYRQVASMFFKEVVSRLVGSFNDRCRLIYGPGARVLESYN